MTQIKANAKNAKNIAQSRVLLHNGKKPELLSRKLRSIEISILHLFLLSFNSLQSAPKSLFKILTLIGLVEILGS
jgi:hypothetical protein